MFNTPVYSTISLSLFNGKTWYPIPGHKDYRISRSGDILSLKFRRSRVLRPFSNQNGCKQVTLDNIRYGINALLRLVFPPCRPTPSDRPQQ